MQNPRDAKQQLRQKIRLALNTISPDERTTLSAQARSLLQLQPQWRDARSVLFYAPLPQELDVWPLLEDALAAGKTVSLPRFDAKANRYAACRIEDTAKDLVSGQFGIREPHSHCALLAGNRLDLVLVPGVAFDLHGRRLGRGKGFYDQLLAIVCGLTCGVAFDEQIVGDIPVEPHDIHLNCILTPTRWVECVG